MALTPKALKIYNKNKEKSNIEFTEPSATQQQFKDECDINNIISRFIRTGDANILTPDGVMENYADLTMLPGSLEEAYDYIELAKETFNNLNSKVRRYFKDDYNNMLSFLQENINNHDKLLESGLLTKDDYDYLEYVTTQEKYPQPDPPHGANIEANASIQPVNPPKDTI